MIFSHSTRLPIILRVGEGLSKDIDDIVRQHNLLFTNKLLVSTVEIADLYPDVINQMQGSMFLIKNNFISEAE
ncbi:MAG: hypothetical protein ACYSQY_11765, partial [Planctomycetota bacterium]